MNIVTFWNRLLEALGGTSGAANVNEFRAKVIPLVTQINTATKTEVVALAALGGTITGATANDTMTAVADATAASTDTSAASLTSVNTAIAAIENNFADLQTKVNAIIAALKA